MAAVLAGGEAIGPAEGAGESLVGGETEIQRNSQNSVIGIAQRFERKGQPAIANIIPEGHAGSLAETARKMIRRVAELFRHGMKGGLLAAAFEQMSVDFVQGFLHMPEPFVHGFSPPLLMIACLGEKSLIWLAVFGSAALPEFVQTKRSCLWQLLFRVNV